MTDFQVTGLTFKALALVPLYISGEVLTARELSDITAEKFGYTPDEYWTITQIEWGRVLVELEAEGEIVKDGAGWLCLSSS